MTTCVLKLFHNEGGGGTNMWIVHDGKRYYSRINAHMQNTPSNQNMCIAQFHARRKIYGSY